MRRPHPFARSVPPLALALVLGAGCGRGGRVAARLRETEALPIDSALAVATFDSAWSRIGASYYDPGFRGMDWRAVRDTLRPRAAAARQVSQLREAIHELFVRLGESHFALIPADVAARRTSDTLPVGEDGEVGVELRFLDGAAVVSRVIPGSGAQASGIEAGWILERIDALRVDSLVRERRAEALPAERATLGIVLPLSLMARMEGEAGSQVTLLLRGGAGERIERRVVRRAAQGIEVKYGHLPAQRVHIEHERRIDAQGCVGVIRFNVWMTPIVPQFDAAVDALRGCRGMILDLRGNVGGVAAMVMGIGGHFLDSAVSLGTTTSRGVTLRYLVNPRRVDARGNAVTPFARPLAILVDGLSVSTSEIFAAGLQAVGRARVFGEPTPGQALPSTISRLPNGDVMQHVIADFSGVDGRRLEKTGVIPDERVPLRRSDLLAGRDAPLLAALHWIDRASPGRTATAGLAPR